MHESGIRFPLRSLYSRTKSKFYLLAGPQSRSVLGGKEKNIFPCRQLSPGCPGSIHDRCDNVKPLNCSLLDILGPDDTVRHLLRHFYRTTWRRWRQSAPVTMAGVWDNVMLQAPHVRCGLGEEGPTCTIPVTSERFPSFCNVLQC